MLFVKWFVAILFALLVLGFIGLSFMTGSPKDAIAMLRYALPHMHRGKLKVGDDAPDARILAVDGTTYFHIRERVGKRPLMIVFGSYT